MGINRVMEKFVRKLKLPPEFTVCELGDQMMTAVTPKVPAEGFYRQLGCSRYVCIDGNGRASVLADLNDPLPRLVVVRGKPEPEELGQFDLVTDFGTGEHIFNQLQVWRTIHDLCKWKGFIALIRPTQGYPDHGFYNVQPTWVTDIAAANGYETVRLCEVATKRGTNVFAILRKIVDKSFIIPQQGRYQKTLRPLRSYRC